MKEVIKKFKKNKKALFDAKNSYALLCDRCKRIIFNRAKKGRMMRWNLYCDKCKDKLYDTYGDKYD